MLKFIFGKLTKISFFGSIPGRPEPEDEEGQQYHVYYCLLLKSNYRCINHAHCLAIYVLLSRLSTLAPLFKSRQYCLVKVLTNLPVPFMQSSAEWCSSICSQFNKRIQNGQGGWSRRDKLTIHVLRSFLFTWCISLILSQTFVYVTID